MLSIGEFSKICSVTTRTLRHYDAINLLKPNTIHEENGYRFYDVAQIRQLLLINRLKNYNFSLSEIAVLLSTNNRLYMMQQIRAKATEIKSRIEEYKSAARQMEMDLLNLEKGVDIMSFIDHVEVKLVEKEARYILSSRQHMSLADFCQHMDKLMLLAREKNMQFTGAPMAIYHDKEFNPENNDTELAFPVRVEDAYTRILAGGLCATAVCQGAYANLPSVYAKLVEWIQENGYEIAAAPFEEYLNSPAFVKTEAELITHIYFPVKKK